MKFIGKKMTEKEYRDHPAISRSELFWLSDSPEKFKAKMTNPEPQSESLLLGSVFHKLVLDNETFDDEYIVEPSGIDRRTKEGRDQYASWLASVGDRTVVSGKMYEKAAEMSLALSKNKMAMALLNGERECAYFWYDEMTGIDCKCRLDCLRELNGKPLIVDLKTASTCATDKWIRDSIKFGYPLQIGMYSDGVAANYGVYPDFVFIVIEKEFPYSINIFKSTAEYTNYGQDEFRSLIGLYKHCMDTNNWFGYLGESEQIQDLVLPSWLGGRDD